MPKFLESDHSPHKPRRQGFIWRSLDDDFRLSAKRRQLGLDFNLSSPVSVFNEERTRRRGEEEFGGDVDEEEDPNKDADETEEEEEQEFGLEAEEEEDGMDVDDDHPRTFRDEND